MSKTQLLAEILRMAPADRRALISDAIDSLPEGYMIDPEMTPELRMELDRRLDDHLKNPSKGRSWEQVSARAKAVIRGINANRISPSSSRKPKKTSLPR